MPSDEKVPIDLLEDCVEPRLRRCVCDVLYRHCLPDRTLAHTDLCRLPRFPFFPLASLKSDFEKEANARSSFLGLDSKWLQTGRYQNRLAHVELMLYLVRPRRGSSDSTPF